MFETKFTKTFFKRMSSDTSKAFEKAFEAAGEALDEAGKALDEAFKDFDKHFQGMGDGAARIETDSIVVTIEDGVVDIKGAVKRLKINGKGYTIPAPEDPAAR